ncbi:MAG: GntR family transcriptional regulator [Chitinophagaceae bacterium]
MKLESHSYKAYTEIRKKILTHQLSPDTRLKEDTWAKKLDISRMAVREALTRLLGEGLVKAGVKGGYFIKPMTPFDIHEIRELREILELGAIRLAIKQMTKLQIEKLEKICDDFTSMVTQGYYNGVCEVDIKFHETLIEYSGNSKLLAAYRASHIPLFHMIIGKTSEYMNDYDITDNEHRQLVKALKAKKLPLAEKILSDHFLRGESIVLEMD